MGEGTWVISHAGRGSQAVAGISRFGRRTWTREHGTHTLVDLVQNIFRDCDLAPNRKMVVDDGVMIIGGLVF